MKDMSRFFKGVLAGVALSAVIGGIGYVGVTEYGWWQTAKGSMTDKVYQEKTEYIEDLIDQYFLDDVDEEAVADGMYAGLLSGLDDPYSKYYTALEYESIYEEAEGHYEGIGVVMQQNENGLVNIIRIYEGAPGEKAGLLPGDIIYKVNEEDITGMELAQVAKKIKNPKTNPVHLTIVREGENDYLELDIQKEDIQIPVVDHEMVGEDTGYLAIYEFTGTTFTQYQEAYADLKSKGMKKLVVDLRGNPGGLLDSVCDILNSMLPEGTIVYTEDKYGNRSDRTSEGKTPIDIPLVVLVDGYSASASEIFAGAVQDYQIGTIVGTTTYGKGVVQTVKQLPDGSAVKLTISNYFTPKGNNINGKGITPEVEIELDKSLRQKASISQEEDNQLQKALEVVNKQEK